MYKTREDVEAMIEMIELIKFKLRQFGFWIVKSVSIPTPGKIHSEPTQEPPGDNSV